MHDLFFSYQQSLRRLEEILQEPKTVANRDSAIKRFELTFELSWKTLQKYLGSQGILCRSPRECFRGGFTVGLLADDPTWSQIIEDRNESVHTYDETTAERIYQHLPHYLEKFQTLENLLKNAS